MTHRSVEVGVGVGPVRVGEVGVGVEDGIASLEPNDDFAMGAPPGAPFLHCSPDFFSFPFPSPPHS